MAKNTRIEELSALILKAKKAYYDTDNAIMTDDEYDTLEKELRTLDPNNPALTGVGTVDDSDDVGAAFPKVSHSIPMGSQTKCANEKEFEKWLSLLDVDDDFVATLKLDGSSLAVYYGKDGKLDKTVTRGNGKVGRDVTSNGKNFIGMQSKVAASSGVSVRGEVVLTVDKWKKIDADSPNPRNLCAGIISREDGENSDQLRFIAFEADLEGQEFNTEMEKLEWLEKNGFETVPYRFIPKGKVLEEVVKFYKEVKNERKEQAVDINGNSVWIDGLVIKVNSVKLQKELGESSNRPKWSTALKFPSPGAETVLKNVEFGVGHTGAITPVGLVEPVEIGGTTVGRVTLNNWDYISAMDIAIGDKVKIVKGGDIIPKLVNVTDRPKTRKAIPAPKNCPVCGSDVGFDKNIDGSDGVVVRCVNENCPAQAIGKFKRLVGKLEILEIGESIIEAMYNSKIIKTIADLFRIEKYKSDIAKLEVGNGVWGEKRTQTMIDEISKKKEMTLDVFLGMLGIQGLGQRRAKIIMEKDSKLKEIENWRNGYLVEVADKVGVPNLAKSISDKVENYKSLIDDLLTVVSIKSETKSVAKGGKLNGKTFVLTGKMSRGRNEIEADIKAAGGEPQESLGKSTQYLVQADPNSASSKTQKAQKYGTKVISEEELMEMMKGD